MLKLCDPGRHSDQGAQTAHTTFGDKPECKCHPAVRPAGAGTAAAKAKGKGICTEQREARGLFIGSKSLHEAEVLNHDTNVSEQSLGAGTQGRILLRRPRLSLGEYSAPRPLRSDG